MTAKLLVFDTHPVQYRVPVWKKMNDIKPDLIHVAYATDCSVKGFTDADFGKTFSWDEPLLSGYDNTVLRCENGEPLSGWNSLNGRGVNQLIKKVKPDAIFLTGLNYRYELIVYSYAISHRIPLWLRQETQDYAFNRSALKSFLRSCLYRIVYLGFSRIFFIGELNRIHYLKHGVSHSKLRRANYSTVNRLSDLSEIEKKDLRAEYRKKANILPSDFVIGFSGKFVTKKNPEIIFEMLEHLEESLRKRTKLYFIGSGPLESHLAELGEEAMRKYGIKAHFVGFVNQTQLPGHYVTMDVLVLPSRRMGETWGLVVNEAIQAGCSVVVSDAVGCGADFSSWERVRIFEEGNATGLSQHIVDLAAYNHDFNWATEKLRLYSMEAVAEAIASELNVTDQNDPGEKQDSALV